MPVSISGEHSGFRPFGRPRDNYRETPVSFAGHIVGEMAQDMLQAAIDRGDQRSIERILKAVPLQTSPTGCRLRAWQELLCPGNFQEMLQALTLGLEDALSRFGDVVVTTALIVE